MHPQHPHGQGHPHGATHAHGGQGGPNWEALYSEKSVESLPWYYPHLEPEIKERLDNLSPQAHILDIGAGPGTQAIEMAKLGYNVTATDISKAAMEKARLRAAEEGVRLEFLQDDILDSKLIGEYEVILDRGCFHSITPVDRGKFVATVHKLLKPKGLFLLKTFSKEEKGPSGGHRFSADEIKDIFHTGFEIETIKETVFQTMMDYEPKGLFCIMRKKDQP